MYTHARANDREKGGEDERAVTSSTIVERHTEHSLPSGSPILAGHDATAREQDATSPGHEANSAVQMPVECSSSR